MDTHSPFAVPFTQLRMWSHVDEAAESADDSLRAAIMAAPRCWTVVTNSPCSYMFHRRPPNRPAPCDSTSVTQEAAEATQHGPDEEDDGGCDGCDGVIGREVCSSVLLLRSLRKCATLDGVSQEDGGKLARSS
jgi:hypothetical protein